MHPIFILVRPQMGENIGSAARAMLNFGLANMRVVNPRDGWPNRKAKALASGAGKVLDNARIFGSVQEACYDLNYVFASSARERKLGKQEIPLVESIEEGRELLLTGSKVGFLFGPEQSGLSNEDLSFCHKVVYLSTSENFKSINLSQCVMLFAYEWFRGLKLEPKRNEGKTSLPPASHEEVGELLKRLISNLDEKNYFWPEDKERSLKLYIKNLFAKFPLNSSDVRFLHGVLRALADKQDK